MISISRSLRSKKLARLEQIRHNERRLLERVGNIIRRERQSRSSEVFRVETRATTRLIPAHRDVRVHLVSGKSFVARVLNISTDAIALDADFSWVRDTELLSVGGKHVEMGRRLRSGAVLVFKKALRGPITEDVVLNTAHL